MVVLKFITDFFLLKNSVSAQIQDGGLILLSTPVPKNFVLSDTQCPIRLWGKEIKDYVQLRIDADLWS